MLHQVKSYIKYKLNAGNADSFSPFVSKLYSEVIEPKKQYYIFQELEELRYSLLSDKREIEVTDFGAGSKIMKGNLRKVADIARHSVGGQNESELLFKLINHFKPQTMLELGTSLGVNTLYQLNGNPSGKIISFEGCPYTAKIAKENFQKFNVEPEVVVGNLDETLNKKVIELESLDYVFFDANHQYKPTVQYFEACLTKAHNETLFIFDDIHWTEGMERAWQEIKKHPKVTLTIDLFDLGLVFFREEEKKQHLELKF